MSIIRAHEVQLGGYKLYRWIDYYACPQVVTVFSAPNYCDNYGNKGAILKLSVSVKVIQNNIMSFVQYEASPHPFVLSNFMNIFTWSCPFLA
jgi:serine/threonine-protein phosphatase 2B catalytic subunit